MFKLKRRCPQRSLLLLLSIVAVFFQSSSPLAYPKKSKIQEVPLSEIPEPKDQEVCFSPETPCDLKLIKLVQSAKQSLDIAIYDINRDQLVHEIILAAKRIPVRVLVDKRQAKGDHSLVPLLVKAGVPLKFGHQRGIMHNKFIIADRKMMETGSFNYTNHATESNNENQIYLATPSIIDQYARRFSELWIKGQAPS